MNLMARDWIICHEVHDKHGYSSTDIILFIFTPGFKQGVLGSSILPTFPYTLNELSIAHIIWIKAEQPVSSTLEVAWYSFWL